MVINSQVFVFIFLPLLFLINALILGINRKWSTYASNVLLVLASLIFYAWGSLSTLPLLIVEAVVCYVLALLVGKSENKNTKKLFMIIGAVFFIGTLCLFKYLPFILSVFGIKTNGNVVTGALSGGVMPMGISFFTYSAVSYIVDVYKGKVKETKDFTKVLLYLSLFAKLTAGPIVRYGELEAAFCERHLDAKQTAYGIRRFILGLAKKMLIANNVALIADAAFGLGGDALTGSVARVGAFAYLLQIYFDFSGYSDMAIAVGQIFGFKFCENFNYPYASFTVKDFWRRWHISVSSWFRDYLYIPLGGNRKGRFRACLNKITVFFFTGLWHGANFTYIIWGLWHGLFLLLEEYLGPVFDKFFGKEKGGFTAKLQKGLSYVYTMLVVYLGFAMFRAPDAGYGFMYIGKIFGSWGNPGAILTDFSEVINPFIIVMFVIGIIAAFPIKKLISAKFSKYEKTLEILSFVYVIAVFAVCTLSLATQTYNPFIYAQF